MNRLKLILILMSLLLTFGEVLSRPSKTFWGRECADGTRESVTVYDDSDNGCWDHVTGRNCANGKGTVAASPSAIKHLTGEDACIQMALKAEESSGEGYLMSGDLATQDWEFMVTDPNGDDLFRLYVTSVTPDKLYYDDLSSAQKKSIAASITDKLITTYPNPATDKIFLDLSELNNINPEGLSISIINYLGIEVFTSSIITNNKFTIDVSEFKHGNYFIVLKKNNDNIFTKQININK